MSLKENLTKIKDQIRETENETKNPGKVKLIAVTKTRDFQTINKAYECGVTSISVALRPLILRTSASRYPHHRFFRDSRAARLRD